MFLAEPPRTAYDLHFRLLGINVRVTPFFWLASIVLGWEVAQGFAAGSNGEMNVGVGLLIWTAAVFISILVHEFGHALAFRYYGTNADVVLYHFGGLAIPRRSATFGYGYHPWQDPKKQIVISAAGPIGQLILGIAVAAAFYVGGYFVPNPLPFIHKLDFLRGGKDAAIFMEAFEVSIIVSSIWWALLNLLPIYPLDGGQIAREVFTLSNPREGIRFSLILSIVAAGSVAVWGFMDNQTFTGIMFGMLAYSSFMALQAYMGGGYG